MLTNYRDITPLFMQYYSVFVKINMINDNNNNIMTGH